MTTSLLAKVCACCGDVPAEAGSPYCAECEEVLREEADAEEARRTPITNEVMP